MAISAYHKFEDLYYLPRVILDINSNYIFYLRHYSDTIYETVLFCVPVKSVCAYNLRITENYEEFDIHKLAVLLDTIFIGYTNRHLPLVFEYHNLLKEYQKASDYLQKATDVSNNLAEKTKHLESENCRLKALLKKFSSEASQSE
jgi:hypothetical protein